MSWIEYHTALRDHWKIKRLATALEVDYLVALGAVSCLWLWAAEYAPTGDLRRFSDEEIRFAARIEALKFSKKTLQACHLLTEGQFINDWGKHGLKLLQSKRKANREYARRKRNSGYPLDTQRIAIPTIPNHTIPNQPESKDPPKKRGSKESIFNDQEKAVLGTVRKRTNIYALIEDFKKTHSVYPPKDLLLRVCQQFLDKGADIKEPYPYLKAALHRAVQDEENLAWKKQGAAPSIAEIIKTMGK